MSFYLLDKNIVEDIRHSLKGLPTPGAAVARSVDRKGATVSPILAIAEGSIREPQTSDEILSSLRSDTQAVEMFYRHAHTDTHALQNLATEMATIFGAHWKEKTSLLIPLTNSLQSLLSRTYSVVDAKGVLKEIDLLCEKFSVPRIHPLITCAIACLYNHSGARKVLKPAKNPSSGDSYNAVSDIRMLLETAKIRDMLQQVSPNRVVNLLSSDKNLNDFSRILRVTVTTSVSLEDLNIEVVHFQATISEALFPLIAKQKKELDYVYSYFRESEKIGGDTI